MPAFQYHDDIIARFPDVVGGVIFASGMTNGETPPELKGVYEREQQAVIQRIGEASLSQIPSIKAWRGAFREFGVEPTKYRSATEALLRRLTKKGDIPSINTLVDLGNLVSIRYGLPLAVFDTRSLQGTLTVHFANGDERFTTLGQDEIEHPEPGEVVFSGEDKLVFARRWCWRQSRQSAATESTTDAIITVEAHHLTGRSDVETALVDLQGLLKAYASGSFSAHIADKNTPLCVG